MQVLREPLEFRRACDDARARGLSVGFVPTMGALHEGHAALIREARKHAEFVAVSVFVNPTQFGPNEDLARYPRTLEKDAEMCGAAGASIVFAPTDKTMYPPGDETRVRVGATAAELCGAFRPGHFEGVATVVTKLFSLAGACTAVFGRKDYQQLQVIKRFTADLFLPVTIIGLRTVREPDGLAMSSRNAYLSPEQRLAALAIPAASPRRRAPSPPGSATPALSPRSPAPRSPPSPPRSTTSTRRIPTRSASSAPRRPSAIARCSPSRSASAARA